MVKTLLLTQVHQELGLQLVDGTKGNVGSFRGMGPVLVTIHCEEALPQPGAGSDDSNTTACDRCSLVDGLNIRGFQDWDRVRHRFEVIDQRN